MLQYNLTQRERQILVKLYELSRHSKEEFEAEIIDLGADAGPSAELARLDFGGKGCCREGIAAELKEIVGDTGGVYAEGLQPDSGESDLGLGPGLDPRCRGRRG